MKNKFVLPLFILIFLYFGQTSFSQFRYRDGYYIKNDGGRVETRLENKRWTTWSNDYLLVSEDGNTKKISLKEIQEFGIEDNLKFITASVDIEKSSDNVKDMEGEIPPNFVREEVLLKVLVEGKYSLFVYVGDNVRKFFYRVENGEILQLVRRRYKIENQIITVMEENLFRKQLAEMEDCAGLDLVAVNYEAVSLRNAFLAMNKCAGSKVDFVKQNVVQSRFGLSISAGVILSDVNIDRSYYDFKMKSTAPTAALNLSYKVPLLYNEVGIKLSGIYNKIETESVQDFPNSFTDRNVSFSLSEVILGFSGEYIFFTGNNSALFAGAGYHVPLLLDQTVYKETVSDLEYSGDDLDSFPSFYAGYQVGKFDLKVQYFLRNSNVLKGFERFEANLDQIYLSLGYTIF